MKLYKILSGMLLNYNDQCYKIASIDWDTLLNEDNLYIYIQKTIGSFISISEEEFESLLKEEILAPIGQQELWASGVTYLRSREARIEESKDAGDFYDRVYAAERPELFFKATANRIVGSGGQVNIRRDSTWNVPEPELTLFINSKGIIQGYTIGNDMSSRSIEAENPLYLPQAKTYDRCAGLGPCLYITDLPISPDSLIEMEIIRNGKLIFSDSIGINKMKRAYRELVDFLLRECTFSKGCYLMTGTGIVPPDEFTLVSGDEIQITIQPIGTLVNFVS